MHGSIPTDPIRTANPGPVAPARSARLAALQAFAKKYAPAALVLTPILALFIAYAREHVWLCDDAFISFRYAQNLVLGRGLVFNIGERVEGYTNFLWVMELAGIWKVFGVRPEHSYAFLSALYTAGTLWLTLQLARSTPFGREKLVAMAGALFLLVVNRNFVVWSGGGLETRQFTFFVVAAIWLMRSRAESRARPYLAASLCWACAELTRPEATMLFACGGLWLLARSGAERRFRFRELAAYCAPFALIVGAHFLFRYLYYGDLFPNTYYAKHIRPWPELGFPYLTMASIESGLYLTLPLAAVGMSARIALGRDGVHALSLLCIVAHAAYLVRLGGDHFELRPLDFYWPLLSVAVVDGLLLLRRGLSGWLSATALRGLAPAASWLVVACAALVVTIYCTIFQVAHIELTRDLTRRDQTYRLFAPVEEKTVPFAFLVPGMRTLAPLYNEASWIASKQGAGVRYQEHRVFWQARTAEFGAYQGHVDALFPADAVMATGPIGVVGYVLSNLTIIDVFGLTDRTVARNPVTRPNSQRHVAHDRKPPPGYLEARGVNLDVLASGERFGPASEHALRITDSVWMPLSSPDPTWLRRAFSGPRLWWKHLHPSLERNQVWMAGKPHRAVAALGFFDAGLDGWTARGEAMAEVVPARAPSATGSVGASFINSFHPRAGDAATGELSSPPFTPSADEQLVFLVGGARSSEVGVELRVDDQVVHSWRGLDSDELSFMSHDLTPLAGKTCRLRIYDASESSGGHVLADHFMVTRPE